MGKRSPPVLLIFAAALAVVLLAALLPLAESSDRHHHHGHGHHGHRSHAQGHGGEEAEEVVVGKKGRTWPCCDNCGGCTKSIPPQCQCLDASRGGCHPACRDCVRSSLSVDPPVYQCMDRITNFCLRRCTAVAAH